MLIINTKLPKLCHAKVGGTVRLTGPDGEPIPELFIVSTFNEKGRRAARIGLSHGLYDEERPLFLTSLESGEAIPMPHLSSRVEIVRDVAVVEGVLPETNIGSNAYQHERELTSLQRRHDKMMEALNMAIDALDKVSDMNNDDHTKQAMADCASFSVRNVRKCISKITKQRG